MIAPTKRAYTWKKRKKRKEKHGHTRSRPTKRPAPSNPSEVTTIFDRTEPNRQKQLLNHKSRRMRKPTKRLACPAKTQIDLGIRPIWSESSLCALLVAKDQLFLQADSEHLSDGADAQADLSLCWAHKSFCWFCHVVAHKITRKRLCGLAPQMNRVMRKPALYPLRKTKAQISLRIRAVSSGPLFFASSTV